MATRIYLPRWFNDGSTHDFVGQIVQDNGAPIDVEIEFDFQYLLFIDGIGLTIFCNTIEWLLKRGVKCFFSNYKNLSEPILYLDDCGFFRNYVREPLRENARVRDTTVPLTKIDYAESHGWLDLRATPWLANKLLVREDALGTIRACIKEIFNNVADHSSENIACAHMQYYPQKDEVQITISDFGRGIPANIREKYNDADDGELIKLSTEEGITTKSHPNNRGAGLSTLVDCVTMNGGWIRISSFKGTLICRRDQNAHVTKTTWAANGAYPGTLVNVTLKTDLFVGDETEEADFQWS